MEDLTSKAKPKEIVYIMDHESVNGFCTIGLFEDSSVIYRLTKDASLIRKPGRPDHPIELRDEECEVYRPINPNDSISRNIGRTYDSEESLSREFGRPYYPLELGGDE